jgi:hypothetical protein
MKVFRAVPAVVCAALLGLWLSPGVKADDYDKKTTVTFSGPVEIPPVHIKGMRVLPAGTYVFKLLNSSSNRHIVQIFNKDQAVELAKVTKTPVLALQADVPVEVEKPEEAEVVTVLQQAPIVAVRPTGEEVEIAQVVQSEPPAVAAAAPVEVAENKLPGTASSLPLILLCGLLALGGGLGVRAMRKAIR